MCIWTRLTNQDLAFINVTAVADDYHHLARATLGGLSFQKVEFRVSEKSDDAHRCILEAHSITWGLTFLV